MGRWIAVFVMAALAPEAGAQGVPLGEISSLADLDAAMGMPETVPGSVLGPPPSANPGPGMDGSYRVEYALFDTIEQSLFGDVYAEGTWKPLSFSTLFSEGWLEPWASGPAGQTGLTPRHGWLGAFEGVFYRLWVTGLTYQNNVSKPFGGQGYTGSTVIFLPFSRRFELALGVPWLQSNGTAEPGRGYRSDVGDLIIGTRLMLSESAGLTQTLNLDTRVPTGQVETGGNVMALTPRYEFWSNPTGAWVARGGFGVNVPLNKNDLRPSVVTRPNGVIGLGESTAQTAITADLAIGRYFRPHDVAFGDLVLYAACNLITPLEDRGTYTYVGVGPGTRFHIANDYYLLHNWEFPLIGPQPFDYQMQLAILKVF